MSTLLGKLASPALENWKISQQVNAIKTEMERSGIPIDQIQMIVTNAKANARKSGDNILNIGSMVHKFCEMWLKGEKFTDPSDPVILSCFEKFKKFWTKHKLKVVESEAKKDDEFKPAKINPKYIGKKMSRNEPCICGSGKKYKHCCGAL